MSLTQSFQTDDSADVMAAIDQSGERTLYIISDVSKDGAWLSLPESEAVLLEEWQ